MADSLIPPGLKNALDKGQLVPFIGSGVSLSVKKNLFPTWVELLQRMAQTLRDEKKDNAANIVDAYCQPEDIDLLQAAKEAYKKLGKARFNEVMSKTFKIPQPSDADLSLPQAIWNLNPGIVITTNYDQVLTWANPQAEIRLNSHKDELAGLIRNLSPALPQVWHLHGHISTLGSLILAPSQYADFYDAVKKNEYAAAKFQLKFLCANQTLLFIGFGLEKYVLDLLEDVFESFGRAAHPHFALVKSGTSAPAELWDRYNVQLIPYEDHGQPLIDVLNELARTKKTVIPVSGLVPPIPAVPPVVPAAYTAWLIKHCLKGIELTGMRPNLGVGVTLNNVYVPVVISNREGGLGTPGNPEMAPAELRPKEDKDRYRLLQSIIDDQSLYVSGPPGSGKTTFCDWLALTICQGELKKHPVPAPTGFEEVFPERLRGYLPVLIRLRDFWDQLPQRDRGATLSRLQLEGVLERWVDSKKNGGLTWAIVKSHLDYGTALLIFDGVDEVPTEGTKPQHPAEPRNLLLSGLYDAVESWTEAKPWTNARNRLLVTSRPYGLNSVQIQNLGLNHEPLEEMPDELQQLLVRRWFEVLGKSEHFDKLWSEVRNRAEILELAANPLLLTAICIVYGDGDRGLPQHEFDLYERIVDSVLCKRYSEIGNEAKWAKQNLGVIAYDMHTGEGLGEDRKAPQPAATFTEIEQMIRYDQGREKSHEFQQKTPQETREELLSQSGLLLPRGDQNAEFYHLTIQDFFTAEQLFDRHESEGRKQVFLTRGGVPGWRKSLGLLFGAILHKHSGARRAIQLLTSLIAQLQPEQIPLGVVLSDCWRILQGRGKTLADESNAKFRQFCQAAIRPETPVAQRMELALALGRLGDPRIANDLSDSETWVEKPSTWVTVKKGTYPVGDSAMRKEFKDYWEEAALNPAKFSLNKPIQLSRFPVTNQQFAAFIQAGGYREPDHWTERMDDHGSWEWRESAQITAPRYWNDPKWNGPTQPVVGVSWFEARAYCHWAKCRLPTEREWEAAARGQAGNNYPWGPDWLEGICNTTETKLGVTTPVGIFEGSQSECGAEDMAGNVWEWCDDLWSSSDPYRVVRGGSWLLYSWFARSAIRNGLRPHDRLSNVGIRVVALRQDS
jgi:formylglycine-generating enzyme required for sulfatase activity